MGTILLVEDEQWQGKICTRELVEEGHDVDWVTSGESLYSTIAKKDYDLIILDIFLPDSNGLEIVNRLLNRRKLPPVLIYTAYPKSKWMEFGRPEDEYLLKSSDLKLLKARVRNLLKRPEGN